MRQLRENRIKRKLERGEIVSVVEGFHTAEIVDFLGPMGFDGVWVETEHGAIDFREIQNITRSCDLWGMTSLIRVNRVDYGLIYRTLDQGAQGIIVPHVDTAEQAREVVRAARYAPIGERGMYESRQAYGLDSKQYFQSANRETLVVVMIEDILAVENLPEILTVDDIDVFFVAPSDLGAEYGPDRTDRPPEGQADDCRCRSAHLRCRTHCRGHRLGIDGGGSGRGRSEIPDD